MVEGKQIKISVTQQGKYFNISSNALDFSSRGGMTQVILNTNDSWIATVSDEWITLSAYEGTDDCSLTVTVSDNASATSRSGYVDIAPSGAKPVRITVNQSARYLTVSTNKLDFFYNGGTSDPITINTDGTAVITTLEDWISISRENDSQFTISITRNYGEARNGTVIVSLNDLVDGTISVIVGINQQKDPFNGHEYVDMGLRVLWATCNVGASKPEEYGDYFAWGEIEPYYENGYAQSYSPNWKSGKQGYGWSSFRYCNGSYSSLSKYITDSYYGTVDNKAILDSSDDVASVKWGGGWRMPTEIDMHELADSCIWIWTTLNGVGGCLVTSNKTGYEGASIFLPAAGYRVGTSLENVGSHGNYWSSSLNAGDPDFARRLFFNSSTHDRINSLRYDGRTVRPVCPKDYLQ
jgi:hypothetical protein